MNDYEKEFDEIFQQISGRIDKTDVKQFIDVIVHFSNIAVDKISLIQNKSNIIWFIKICKAMKEEHVSLNMFNRLIQGSDRINKEEFTKKIEKDLKLNLDENYNDFLNNISHSNRDVSYNKFEEGYSKEEQA